MISSGLALVRCSLNTIWGAAEKRATSAPSILKARSGMNPLIDGFCLGSKSGEEAADFLPHFGSPRQALPIQANQADKPVAGVDRHDIILRGGCSARLADPIDQKRFHVRLKLAQNRVGLHDVRPRFQRQKRLSGPCGTWVQHADPAIEA